MLKCVVMILSMTDVENRKSYTGSRIVANGFPERAALGQAPGLGWCGQRENRTPEKAMLEGTPRVLKRENCSAPVLWV